MLAKIVIVCTMMAVCHAGFYHHSSGSFQNFGGHGLQHHPHEQYAAPTQVVEEVHKEHEHEHEHGHDHFVGEYSYPKYKYKYSVEDPHTGDHKSHHESRDGEVVKGEYSFLQPDGSFRKVTYTADPHTGFHAVVHNTPPLIHHQ